MLTFHSIFSLDTLDSRLTARSSPPSKAPPLSQSQRLRTEASPSRWRTPEFWLYYAVIAVAIPWMFKATYDISKESHPNFHKYAHLLSPGWILGRRVDNSDAQYSNFRDNIPILWVVVLAHFALRRGFDNLFAKLFPTPPQNSTYRASHNITRRKMFDVLFAVVFLTCLHSVSILKILVILSANYLISFFHPDSVLNPILTWVFNVGVLFANEYFEGYHFRLILPWLIAGEGAGVGYSMDHLFGGGLLPRWEISFNITVLRLISYNMDHYWAAQKLPQTDDRVVIGRYQGNVQELILEQKKKLLDPTSINERDRIEIPAIMQDYGFLNYLAYVLYSPLYLAGPIITFNDFIHQQRYPLPTTTLSYTIKYAIRLLISILAMEVVLHFFYVVAISKTAHTNASWASDTPLQLSMIGYFNLHIIWLKLLIPWRFFRLWALLDGVDPPENMIRCMSNNYSPLAFWRAWHRSFNRWIVRYIYIPVGGANRPIMNMVLVFTFVALWHDLSFKLLTWGWLVVLFVLPEIIAKNVFQKRLEAHPAYRVICGIGAVANVFMMMTANLVGFAIGLDGLRDLVAGVVGSWAGYGFVLIASAALFVGVMIMFEVREGEKRRGINLRC